MKYDLEETISVQEKPLWVMKTMLGSLSSEWTVNNEGGDSWSGYFMILNFTTTV